MRHRVLAEVLKGAATACGERQLAEVRLTRFFTVAMLDDGSVGAAMSYYYHLDDSALEAAERAMPVRNGNPCSAMNTEAIRAAAFASSVRHEEADRIFAATAAAVASAASRPVIANGGDSTFLVSRRRPPWPAPRHALVVGFGGFLEPLLAENSVLSVHSLELLLDSPSAPRYRGQMDELARRYPTKQLTGSSRLTSPVEVRRFDLIAVTGSALCNGTLEYFLDNKSRKGTIVVQGQSACVHPKALFDSGVSWIATTLKPSGLMDLARTGHDGEAMRPTLQGGLPWIYICPRKPDIGREQP